MDNNQAQKLIGSSENIERLLKKILEAIEDKKS